MTFTPIVSSRLSVSKMAGEVREERFTEEILISLLSHGRKPGWWDSEADKITYDLMFKLFECCFKV